jgi:protein required for attachment to host cells
MNVEDFSDNTWIAVIDGTKTANFENLGLKLLITNLRQRLRTKEITMPLAVSDLKKFLVKYRTLPSLQADLDKIAR